MPAPLTLLTFATLVPLGAFVLLLLAGRRMGTTVCGVLGTTSSVTAFSLALAALMHWLNGGVVDGVPWGAGRGPLISVSAWSPLNPVGMHVDSLSLLVATAGLLVSAAAHVFTTGYLRHDVRGPRTFALLALADAALVGLVCAPSLPVWLAWAFAGGVSAYLLAAPAPLGPGGLGVTPVPRGFTAADLSYRARASLGLLVTRGVGDAALLLATGLLLLHGRSTGWASLWSWPADVLSAATSAAGTGAAHSALLPLVSTPAAVAWLLVVAGCAHAAAFPLAVLLPDAKGAPTPAAALAYGVTLLPAGPLLLCRVFPLLGEGQLDALALAGAGTLVVAGVGALCESDLRRWLAWTSVGLTGAMLAGVSTGSAGGALLHVVACMFGVPLLMLASGSILHSCLGDRRLSHYGGLLFRMPASALLLAHGAGTILGGPLLAGSGSWSTMLSHAYRAFQAGEWRGTLVAAALLTGLALLAAAAGRAWGLILLGRPRDAAMYASARESATLSVPVAVLAVVATVAGHPVLSPVRQLVTVLPTEIAITVAPDDPTTYRGLELWRDTAPPAPRLPPAPEDFETRDARELAPLPPDDKVPRLVDPLRWGVAAGSFTLGLLLPTALRRRLPGSDRGREFFARSGHLSAALRSGASRLASTCAGLLVTAERFVFTPLLDLAARVLLPVWRLPSRHHSPRRRATATAVVGSFALLALPAVAVLVAPSLRPTMPESPPRPFTPAGLTLASVALPLLGLVLAATLHSLRVAIHETLAALPARLTRPLAPARDRLPPRGRTTRAIVWTFLFLPLLALLALPWLPDPFAPTDLPLAFTPGRYLLALAAAVAALCAAVTAWDEPHARTWTWLGLLPLTSAATAALASTSPALALVSLDLAAAVLGFLLAVTAPLGTPTDREQLLPAVRRHLALSLGTALLAWPALALLPTSAALPLAAASLLLRAGLLPGTSSAFLSTLAALPPPLALLPPGLLLPATLAAACDLPLPARPVLAALLCLLAALSFFAALTERDLRRAVGRWALAGASASVALGPAPLAPDFALLAVACAASAAVFLVSLVEHDLGHREPSRLTGLAARSPGGYAWFTLAALALAGAPPFSLFAARLLAPAATTPDTAHTLAASLPLLLHAPLWLLASAATLSLLHRVYLGPPAGDLTPLDLSPRERLVLVLLSLTAAAGTLAPLTLLPRH